MTCLKIEKIELFNMNIIILKVLFTTRSQHAPCLEERIAITTHAFQLLIVLLSSYQFKHLGNIKILPSQVGIKDFREREMQDV